MSRAHPIAIDGHTRVYGILGHPVRHSLSPAMHNAAFAALGTNAVYVAFPVAPERLGAALDGLAAAEVAGLNLTVPHKTAALAHLARCSEAARAIGAVNALRLEPEGWAGANTDGQGFLLSLERDLDWAPAGRRVLLLGAGGSARAIGYTLLRAGVAWLGLANRTPARAESLAADLAAHAGGTPVVPMGLEAAAGRAPDLLVNTTTVGMGDDRAPLALEPVGVREAVVDIIYAPPRTPLLAEAERLGLRTANGLGMLLYQGVAAFAFWTGVEPPAGAMQAALEAGLAGR